MPTVPTSQRLATIHVMGAGGQYAGRQTVTLGALASRCLRGICETGAMAHGWPCPVASTCEDASPKAWAQYLRLDELDRLGR